MSDERQIDVEQSPVIAERETLVPYSRFQEWQRRRANAGLPPDQPPASEAAILKGPLAAPTHER